MVQIATALLVFFDYCMLGYLIAQRSKSPAGHGFTAMVERETMIDIHPKIGRVSQSGAFFCWTKPLRGGIAL